MSAWCMKSLHSQGPVVCLSSSHAPQKKTQARHPNALVRSSRSLVKKSFPTCSIHVDHVDNSPPHPAGPGSDGSASRDGDQKLGWQRRLLLTGSASVAVGSGLGNVWGELPRVAAMEATSTSYASATLPEVPPGKELAPGLVPSSIIKGCWQLAGGHKGEKETDRTAGPAAVEDFQKFVDAGITTFDTADIYGPSEGLIGRYLRGRNTDTPPVSVYTKCCMFGSTQVNVNLKKIEEKIDLSRKTLGVDQLDLVQYFWQDYDVKNYVRVAQYLAEIQAKGKIKHLGVTNFDVKRLEEIVNADVKLVANQVQYSLLDRRPEVVTADFCKAYGIGILPFGAVGGGFLTERWLGKPLGEAQASNNTYSRGKYFSVIGQVGGWEWLQKLLAVLKPISEKHGVEIADVATRWVLQRPLVAAVIVGARNPSHIPSHQKLSTFTLDAEDLDAISEVLEQSKRARGDIWTWERGGPF